MGRDLEHLLESWSRQELPFERVRLFAPAPVPVVPADDRFRLEVLAARRPGLWWGLRHLRPKARELDVLYAPYVIPPGYRGRNVVLNLGIYEGPFAIPGWRSRLHSLRFAHSARNADAVIANSASTKADLVRYYRIPPEKITVVWPGVARRFRPLQPGEEELVEVAVQRVLGERAPYFLFVGKTSGRRNVPALLEAFAAISGDRPALRLLLLGPGSKAGPLADLIARLGIRHAVRHVEWVEHDDVALLYRGARAFVLPTEHEGFSATIPEAMASGCPVLTIEHAALVEAGLTEGVLALPSADPSVLAEGLARLADDDELCAQLARRAPNLAAPLSWDETARKMMNVLGTVARTSGS